MRIVHTRYEDEHVEIFKELVRDNQGKNVQEVIVNLINYALRKKHGIDEVKKWHLYTIDKEVQHKYQAQDSISADTSKTKRINYAKVKQEFLVLKNTNKMRLAERKFKTLPEKIQIKLTKQKIWPVIDSNQEEISISGDIQIVQETIANPEEIKISHREKIQISDRPKDKISSEEHWKNVTTLLDRLFKYNNLKEAKELMDDQDSEFSGGLEPYYDEYKSRMKSKEETDEEEPKWMTRKELKAIGRIK
jgi:hypothetical protein